MRVGQAPLGWRLGQEGARECCGRQVISELETYFLLGRWDGNGPGIVVVRLRLVSPASMSAVSHAVQQLILYKAEKA